MRFFWTAFLAALLISVTACVKEKTNTSDPLDDSYEDTLKYGKQDYEAMRTYFNAKSELLNRLNERVSSGDTNALILQRVLKTPYDSVAALHLSEQQLDALIYSFYISQDVEAKFDRIKQRLQEQYGGGTNEEDSIP